MGIDLGALAPYTVENATKWFSKTVLGAKVSKQMTRVVGLKGKYKIPLLDMGYDLFQADTDCSFNDGGNDITVTQRLIDPVKIKIQEKFCVQDLEPFFTRQILPSGGKYTNVPAELMLFNLIGERVQKTIELATVRGVLGGASAITSFNLYDGMLEIASNDIAAGSIPVLQRLTVSLTQSNVIASLRAMYDALPLDKAEDTATDGDWKIYCSIATKRAYARAYQAANGALNYNKNFNKDFLDDTGIEIVALAGFNEDTTQAILTRAGNYWMGVDIDGEETSLDLTMGTGSEMRDLFLDATFRMGINTKFPDEMVLNNIS